MYRTENEPVSLAGAVRRREKRGGKNEGMFRDVIENKCSKNVWFTPFHDVIENT